MANKATKAIQTVLDLFIEDVPQPTDRWIPLERKELPPFYKIFLAHIPVGRKKPVPTSDLMAMFKMSQRKVQKMVEELIFIYDIPVVAVKSYPSGYYIPKDKGEVKEGLRAYKNQIATELQRVDKIENVNLEEFHRWMKEEQL